MQLQFHDLPDVCFAQRVKNNRVIDAIQELRLEVLTERLIHLRFHECPVVGTVLENPTRPDVRGHDDHRVAEIHGAPLTVGQAAVVENLQQDVEYIGVRLLDLVKEYDRIRAAAHRLGELPPFLEPDIARRRANQSRDGVLLHVLAHVDADHGVVVVKQEPRERTRGFGLPHPRWPEENKRADRTIRILQPCA